ncbi:caspase, EACC1-associated type [Streptomyces cylindrosporus]|uniref:Caspase family protein n=1 Tax=Streptomyces cylindrosporus TaxID=2927583 RepID=A0ABS9YI42_9ACTN|nr:DnaJ C-terminal domain-containing protein [Streptomyces cylindrosporus]MCI3276614.1 caspase family protein [Streptomyces cylindrosporus]
MTDFAFGPGRRDALLIATGAYDDRTLSTLRSPGQDCASLAGVLADPGIGGFRTEQLKDAQAHQVMRAVERFFMDRSRDDLLLLHISCHGIKDDDGHLYFAARDTDRDLPASTAVPAAFLRERMERCRARTVVVLLDCCYSGAFLPGAKGDDQVHVRDELGGHGRAVLTATNRIEYAWEGEHIELKGPQPSPFTGVLVEGLRTGAADLDGDGRITVTELYEYVYETLHRAGVRQRPQMWVDLEYQVTVAQAVGAPEPVEPEAPLTQPTVSPRGQKGRDVFVRLELTLVETTRGAVKGVAVERRILCSTCHGLGGRTVEECGSCHGSGSGRGNLGQHPPNCLACDGTGWGLGPPCSECAGNGWLDTVSTLTVEIPAGVESGTHIQLADEGDDSADGGPPGDLYIDVVELPHPVYQRVGDDLHRSLTIPAVTARAGGTVELKTLDGRRTLRIAPGTHEGQTLLLPGFGAPRSGAFGRGDIVVHVAIRD